MHSNWVFTVLATLVYLKPHKAPGMASFLYITVQWITALCFLSKNFDSRNVK